MKRSTWASGSGYVPSDSIGFWVARTRNGEGTRWVSWPIVTWRSCMTSSSADCTLAGARLISSASRKLQNTGPSSTSKPPSPAAPPRKILVPTRSAGTRSGVNCSRLKEPPSTSATVFTVRVLARPGTPSSRTCPPARRATSTRSSIASWPTITRLTSNSADSSESWAARAGLGSSSVSSARRRRSSGVTGGRPLSLRDRGLALARLALGVRRLCTERHREGTPLAVALHHHGHLLARLVGVHGGRQVVGAVHRLARDRDDPVALAQAGLGGRAVGHDGADLRAAGRRVARRDAEVGVLDLVAALEDRLDPLDLVDRDREADAG